MACATGKENIVIDAPANITKSPGAVVHQIVLEMVS